MPYYAVRQGKNTGIFQQWEKVKEVIEGHAAEYRKFDNLTLAMEWLQKGHTRDLWPSAGIACDGGCKGNPGPMVIRVYQLGSREMIHENNNLGDGTNNTAELLALEEACKLAYMGQVIYTDSAITLARIAKGCPLKLAETIDEVRRLVQDKELTICKWDTESLGQMPCDCKNLQPLEKEESL